MLLGFAGRQLLVLRLLRALQVWKGEQPFRAELQENAAGEEKKSNSDNMSDFISLCLQEVAMLSSGYF